MTNNKTWQERFREKFVSDFENEVLGGPEELESFISSIVIPQVHEEMKGKVEGVLSELHPSGHAIRRQALEDVLSLFSKE